MKREVGGVNDDKRGSDGVSMPRYRPRRHCLLVTALRCAALTRRGAVRSLLSATHLSAGWEKRMAQEPSSQSWNLMGPWVVFASKSGATDPSLRAGMAGGAAVVEEEGVDSCTEWPLVDDDGGASSTLLLFAAGSSSATGAVWGLWSAVSLASLTDGRVKTRGKPGLRWSVGRRVERARLCGDDE